MHRVEQARGVAGTGGDGVLVVARSASVWPIAATALEPDDAALRASVLPSSSGAQDHDCGQRRAPSRSLIILRGQGATLCRVVARSELLW